MKEMDAWLEADAAYRQAEEKYRAADEARKEADLANNEAAVCLLRAVGGDRKIAYRGLLLSISGRLDGDAPWASVQKMEVLNLDEGD